VSPSPPQRVPGPTAAPPRSDRALVAEGWVTLTGLGGLAEQTPSGEGDGEPALTRLLEHGAGDGDRSDVAPAAGPQQ